MKHNPDPFPFFAQEVSDTSALLPKGEGNSLPLRGRVWDEGELET